MDKELLQSTVRKVLDEMRQRPIPLGVSNRHIHLSAQDYRTAQPAQPAAAGYPGKKTGSSAAGIHRRARTAAGSACGFGAGLSRCRAAKPGACGCPPQMHRDRHGA